MAAKLMRVRDVAQLLDVDGSTVRSWIKLGHLPAIKMPRGQYRIDQRAVDELMAQIGQTVPPPEKAA